MRAAPTVFTASVQKKSIGRCIERSVRRHASHHWERVGCGRAEGAEGALEDGKGPYGAHGDRQGGGQVTLCVYTEFW